jgi:hypothetical protein
VLQNPLSLHSNLVSGFVTSVTDLQWAVRFFDGVFGIKPAVMEIVGGLAATVGILIARAIA